METVRVKEIRQNTPVPTQRQRHTWPARCETARAANSDGQERFNFSCKPLLADNHAKIIDNPHQEVMTIVRIEQKCDSISKPVPKPRRLVIRKNSSSTLPVPKPRKINKLKAVNQILEQFEKDFLPVLEKQIESCQTFIQEFLPQIQVNKKYVPHSKQLLGCISEIFEKETEFYSNIKSVLSRKQPDQIGRCILNHKKLFQLYIEDCKLKINRQLREVFCIDYSVRPDIFLFHIHHLFRIKHLVELTLFKQCAKENIERTHLERAVHLISNTLNKLNHLTTIADIVGAKLNILDQGQILLRNKFSVQRNSDDSYEAIIFLFEKCVVFTTENKSVSPMSFFVYNNHVELSSLGLDGVRDEQLVIGCYEKGRIRRDVYVVKKYGDNQGDVKELQKRIMELLHKQIAEIKCRLMVGKNHNN